MGYVAARGGVEAIEQAQQLARYFRLRGGSAPVDVRQIQEQLRFAVDRVMGEGSLYSPFHAALALKQTESDVSESALMLRAFASTCPRSHVSGVARTAEMRVVRRISAAFQEVPGGQMLGPTRDYAQRLFEFALCDEREEHVREFLAQYVNGARIETDGASPVFPKVLDVLRAEGMVASPPRRAAAEADRPFDITRKALTFPAPRSARLQALARGDTGGLLAFAYSSMRGYGDVHPTIGDLRVGYMPLRVCHPEHGVPVMAGWVLATEAEVIARFAAPEGNGGPMFTVGYGLCFGHNELKAICMAVLDRAMNEPVATAPAENEEFVLSHVDPVESSGFALHYKLPHYVTFQADVARLQAAQLHAAHRKADGVDS